MHEWGKEVGGKDRRGGDGNKKESMETGDEKWRRETGTSEMEEKGTIFKAQYREPVTSYLYQS